MESWELLACSLLAKEGGEKKDGECVCVER
jgi:hypothetical protein